MTIGPLDHYRTAAALGITGSALPVREFERRTGIQTKLALDRARLAAGLPGPVAVDPFWRPRPALRPQAAPVLDPAGVIEGTWH